MWSKAPKSRTKTLREAWNTKTKELLEWATNAMELLSVPPSMTISAFRTRWFIALTMITTLFLPTAMLSIVETKVELFGLTRRLEWRIEVTRRSREKTSSKSKVGILRLARLCSLTNAWLGLRASKVHTIKNLSLWARSSVAIFPTGGRALNLVLMDYIWPTNSGIAMPYWLRLINLPTIKYKHWMLLM